MWIVVLNDDTRHSAWRSRQEAKHQVKTLLECGYKRNRIELDETVSCENGHYYV